MTLEEAINGSIQKGREIEDSRRRIEREDINYLDEIAKLRKENGDIKEFVLDIAKEISPYAIHEHRDILEERFHSVIIACRNLNEKLKLK